MITVTSTEVNELATDIKPQIGDLKGMIEGRIVALNTDEAELKERQQMIKDALEADSAYLEVCEEIKELQKKKKDLRDEILDSTDMSQVVEALNGVKENKKALAQALSGELLAYFKEKNSIRFKDSSGKLYTISFKGMLKETDQMDLFEGGE